MKRIADRALPAILAISLLGCFQSRPAMGADEGAKTQAVETADGPTETVDPIAEGEKLVASQCIQCHKLSRVFRARYSANEWNEALDRMNAIMKENDMEPIDADQRGQIIAYLLAEDRDETAEGKWSRWLESLGHFHFVVVHFPIALLVTLALLEFFHMIARRPLASDVTHFLTWLTTLSSLVAIGLGFLLFWDRTTHPAMLIEHRNLGVLAGGLLAALLALRCIAIRRNSTVLALMYRLTLVAAIVVVTMTGHLGGVLVHGDFLTPLLDLRG